MSTHSTTPVNQPVPPAATPDTPAQIAGANALMEDLRKKTAEALEAAAKIPKGAVSDTVKLG